MVLRMRPEIEEQLKNAGYGVYHHSAVEVCFWTKEALRRGRFCYKHKFYGIDTHRCMQISLAAAWCTNRCIYCWRPNEYFMPGTEMLKDVDPPGEALEKLKELRKRLLSGFGGDPRVDKKMLEEAMEPNHVTFSLSGEPLLYPYMAEAIHYLLDNWDMKSIFIVTNGVVTEGLRRLHEKEAWPTQLYISLTAPDPETYRKVSRPIVLNAWERLQESLKFVSDKPVRRVARITLIRGMNDTKLRLWAKLIQKMNPHFVEVKAYMYLGRSRRRLTQWNMPDHDYVVSWAKELEKYLPGFEFWQEDEPSRIAVLRNVEEEIDPIIKGPIPNV